MKVEGRKEINLFLGKKHSVKLLPDNLACTLSLLSDYSHEGFIIMLIVTQSDYERHKNEGNPKNGYL